MFSFLAFCEFMTCNYQYSWFYCSTKLLDCVADKGDTVIEDIRDDNGVKRVWFPSKKFWDNVSEEYFKRLLSEAVEKGDWDKVKQLKERYKK